MSFSAAAFRMIYGTAWKQEQTADCVERALEAGFAAIDTANQKKHYREDFVGDALRKLAVRGFARTKLFLQSKYTYREGQDHRLPYDPSADFKTQVRASCLNSLQNLHTDHLDSYLLHGPRLDRGLIDSDWEVWAEMERLLEEGKVRSIGVSNVNADQLRELVDKARVRPHAVQNRCFAVRGWDRPVREFCRDRGIVYQGFSLLTANPHAVHDPKTARIARRLDATPEQVIFAFAVRIGILPLTGTTDSAHMKQDLAAPDLALTDEDVKIIQSI